MTGLSEWYEYPNGKAPSEGFLWSDVYQHWSLIEADLHRFYGIDVEDRRLLRRRSYRWLKVRVNALLGVEHSLLRLTLYPPNRQRR